MENKKVVLSKPKDESLEAFKAWMNEFFKNLTGADGDNSMTDEAWEKAWKKFWDKAKK